MGGFGGALRELSTAQKSGKGVSLYSRFVNRPAGRVLAAAAYTAGLTPNQVTLISGAFTFSAVGVVAAVPPSHPTAVAVYLLLVLGFALDSADGQLARLRKAGSPAGEWLDHILDCAKMLGIHLAVLVSLYRFSDLSDTRVLLIPMVFQFAAVMVFFGGILTEQLKRRAQMTERMTAEAAVGAGRQAPAPPAPASTVRSLALLPADYGVFCVAFLFFGSEDLFLVLYSLLGAVHVLFMAAFLVKWFRELS